MSTAQELKVEGITRVEIHNDDFLDTIRKFAYRAAVQNGSVTSDDCHRYADTFGVHPKHHNAYGAIFAQKHIWTSIGYQPSTRPESHGRIVRVWGLKDRWRY